MARFVATFGYAIQPTAKLARRPRRMVTPTRLATRSVVAASSVRVAALA